MISIPVRSVAVAPRTRREHDRRDMSEAGILRRAAFAFERRGMGATALLFRNAGWESEHGCTWLQWQREEAANANHA
jgi:hypothetical protein